ncbi:MAG: PKD domain-containing protein [Bacteroidia bacterium]|nr:PKD domain-containing protein [Bacteroidia bacterium]
MRNNLLILAITLLIINGCNKDKVVVEPISSFSFRGDTISTLKMATLDTCTLFNNSKNADSVFWDFGDGRTSRDNQVILSYSKSGAYTINLTTKNNDGQKSTISKKVVVLDRVMKEIVIDYVQWDTSNTNGWPTSSVVDIYFQIQNYISDTMEPMGIFPNCPILFTSSIVKNINNHYSPPTYHSIVIPITEKFIIDKSFVQFPYGQYGINHAYLFSLMAKDSNGNIFCLENSYAAGGNSCGITQDDIKLNIFKIHFSFFSSVDVICDFE